MAACLCFLNLLVLTLSASLSGFQCALVFFPLCACVCVEMSIDKLYFQYSCSSSGNLSDRKLTFIRKILQIYRALGYILYYTN